MSKKNCKMHLSVSYLFVVFLLFVFLLPEAGRENRGPFAWSGLNLCKPTNSMAQQTCREYQGITQIEDKKTQWTDGHRWTMFESQTVSEFGVSRYSGNWLNRAGNSSTWCQKILQIVRHGKKLYAMASHGTGLEQTNHPDHPERSGT